MLNYFDKLQREGYAVFVGDGDGRTSDSPGKPSDAGSVKGVKGAAPKARKARSAKAKAAAGQAAAGQAAGAAVDAMRAKVAKALGVTGPPKVSATPPLSAAASLRLPGGGGTGHQDALGAAGAAPVPAKTAASKASLDYSRFRLVHDTDGDSDDGGGGDGDGGPGGVVLPGPEAYPDELQELASNPLWGLVLALAGGDGEKALEMIKDPEALQRRPEIAALFAQELDENDEDDGGESDDDNEEGSTEVLETNGSSKKSK
jgi:hypothetical protein